MSQAKINFELTTRCNLNCRHCLRDKSLKKDLDFKLFEKIINQIKAYSINRIGFTGGEPLVYPHFKEVIEKSAEEGFEISFVTNGIGLEKYASFLSQKEIADKISHICVSLEGVNEETNDTIRGKGSFKKALKGIASLYAHKLPFAIKFTINSQNYKDLEQMALFAGKLGAFELQLAFIFPTPENLSLGLALAPNLWKPIRDQISQLQSLVKIGIVESAGGWLKDAFPICAHLAMTEYYVDADGWLCLCCMLPGLAGADKQNTEEKVADLAKTSFVQAHKKLIEKINKLFLIRLNRLENNQISELEHFQCLACAFYLDKLNWLENFPNSKWAQLWKEAKEK